MDAASGKVVSSHAGTEGASLATIVTQALTQRQSEAAEPELAPSEQRQSAPAALAKAAELPDGALVLDEAYANWRDPEGDELPDEWRFAAAPLRAVPAPTTLPRKNRSMYLLAN